MAAERILGLIVMMLGVIGMAAGLYAMVLEAQEGRRRSRSRSVETEWRIQQIGSDARAQMWEEATRHRENGGG